MNPTRIDHISKLFAKRRLSRRQAIATGTASLAAGLTSSGLSIATAQDATPAASPVASGSAEKITYLFVQSFQSGSIVPATGAEGRYTVTLEQGLGQTIYFGDRPSREVGVSPTPQFLEGLGFPEDNPPNAALLLETAPGETEIAVVELFNPTYDEATHTATYEVAVLENWQDSVELGFQDAPADLAALAPEFGNAHLLIDDCADATPLTCYIPCGIVGNLGNHGMCWKASDFYCEPCGIGFDGANAQCNQEFPACNGRCYTDPGEIYAC